MSIDRLTCEEMFRNIDSYLDQALASQELEKVEAHLEECASCAAEYRFEGTLVHEVRGKLQRLKASPDLLERILSRLGSDAPAEGEG